MSCRYPTKAFKSRNCFTLRTPLCNHNLIKPTKFFIAARIGYVGGEQLHEMILLKLGRDRDLILRQHSNSNKLQCFSLAVERSRNEYLLIGINGSRMFSHRELVLGTMLNRETSRGEDEAAKLTNSSLRRLLSYLLLGECALYHYKTTYYKDIDLEKSKYFSLVMFLNYRLG
ncbi:hypothetical protein TcasGA2_TC007690 [Tribolium castaneum]|uniref:Uncharacterized protein n=1 Tax=Tribolium castaneum TaxID=7070 RepID=D2A279_TRICA|nr:hypothetical protein TcasGA2_TC007690 [Tribolium castaneum]